MSILWTDKKRTFLGLPLSFTSYELNEERLLICTGFFTRVEDEIRLYRIRDITLKQTLGQRILGIGTIHCCSSDSTQQEFNITNVKYPKRVRELLSTQVEQERERKHVYSRELVTEGDEFLDEDCL